jgi:hypothetical protein
MSRKIEDTPQKTYSQQMCGEFIEQRLLYVKFKRMVENTMDSHSDIGPHYVIEFESSCASKMDSSHGSEAQQTTSSQAMSGLVTDCRRDIEDTHVPRLAT